MLQKQFNPENRIEEEKMDYNELNILAEFQIYNLLFSKNELLLDDEKTSYLLEVFWKLLGISNQGDKIESKKAAEDLGDALDAKWGLFKQSMMERVQSGTFDKDQLKKIVDYARSGYFRHFRLFDFVLNNSQLSDVKRVSIYQERPMFSGPLNEAMDLQSEEVPE